MTYLRPAQDRGDARFSWLKSRHSFSFGHYYDPNHMGWSALRVINDDEVAPGAGFDTHGHRDMEILSYILQGTIVHEDSMGHRQRIEAGEFQLMSAGTGVRHSEFNGSDSDILKFLQIWLLPNQAGVEPGYGQKAFADKAGLTSVVHPDADGALRAHSDARVYRYQGGEADALKPKGRHLYVHVVKGQVLTNGYALKAGDGVGLQDQALELQGEPGSEALVFDLP